MLFSELYSAYYNVVAKMIERAIQSPLNRNEIRAIIEENAFGENIMKICKMFSVQDSMRFYGNSTEFKYYEIDNKGRMTTHKLYLDPFMDMCNGEIISYGIDKRPSAANVMSALNKAIEITSDWPYRRKPFIQIGDGHIR